VGYAGVFMLVGAGGGCVPVSESGTCDEPFWPQGVGTGVHPLRPKRESPMQPCLVLARLRTVNPCRPSTAQRCATPNHRAFDFWVGEWSVSDTSGRVIASSTIERTPVVASLGALESHSRARTASASTGCPATASGIRRGWGAARGSRVQGRDDQRRDDRSGG